MTTSRHTDRSRRRRATLVAAGALGAVIALTMTSRSDTVASFTDSVTSGGAFNVDQTVDLEGSTTPDGGFSSHESVENALEFAPSITLLPGETTYSPLFLRTSALSSSALVTMGRAENAPTATNDLWSTYLTYGARAVPLPDNPTSVTCDGSTFDRVGAVDLVPRGSDLGHEPAGDFTLEARAGSTTMVCFEFSLDSDVIAEPSLNGSTVSPVWTFTGVQS